MVLGTPEHSWNAFYLLMLNVVGLDIVGSISILAVRGIRRRHLDLEKRVRAAVAVTLDVVPGFISVGSTVDVTLLSQHAVRVDVVLRRRFGGEVPESLAETIAAEVQEKTQCQCNVTLEAIPLLTHMGIKR